MWPEIKYIISMCHLICWYLLFQIRWRESTVMGRFLTRMIFFLFLFPLLPLKNSDWSSLLLIFQLQSLFFWYLIFVLDPFVKNLYLFNFILQSQFVMYFFSMWSSFFWFLIYFLSFFLNLFIFLISSFNWKFIVAL
jgi:hypothetical protein